MVTISEDDMVNGRSAGDIIADAFHTPVEVIFTDDLPIIHQGGERVTAKMLQYLAEITGELVASSDPLTGIRQYKPRGKA